MAALTPQSARAIRPLSDLNLLVAPNSPWEKWGMPELCEWTRHTGRLPRESDPPWARQALAIHIAALLITDTGGATLQLVVESVGPDGSPGPGAQLRLTRGRTPGVLQDNNRRAQSFASPSSVAIPPGLLAALKKAIVVLGADEPLSPAVMAAVQRACENAYVALENPGAIAAGFDADSTLQDTALLATLDEAGTDREGDSEQSGAVIQETGVIVSVPHENGSGGQKEHVAARPPTLAVLSPNSHPHTGSHTDSQPALLSPERETVAGDSPIAATTTATVGEGSGGSQAAAAIDSDASDDDAGGADDGHAHPPNHNNHDVRGHDAARDHDARDTAAVAPRNTTTATAAVPAPAGTSTVGTAAARASLLAGRVDKPGYVSPGTYAAKRKQEDEHFKPKSPDNDRLSMLLGVAPLEEAHASPATSNAATPTTSTATSASTGGCSMGVVATATPPPSPHQATATVTATPHLRLGSGSIAHGSSHHTNAAVGGATTTGTTTSTPSCVPASARSARGSARLVSLSPQQDDALTWAARMAEVGTAARAAVEAAKEEMRVRIEETEAAMSDLEEECKKKAAASEAEKQEAVAEAIAAKDTLAAECVELSRQLEQARGALAAAHADALALATSHAAALAAAEALRVQEGEARERAVAALRTELASVSAGLAASLAAHTADKEVHAAALREAAADLEAVRCDVSALSKQLAQAGAVSKEAFADAQLASDAAIAELNSQVSALSLERDALQQQLDGESASHAANAACLQGEIAGALNALAAASTALANSQQQAGEQAEEFKEKLAAVTGERDGLAAQAADLTTALAAEKAALAVERSALANEQAARAADVAALSTEHHETKMAADAAIAEKDGELEDVRVRLEELHEVVGNLEGQLRVREAQLEAAKSEVEALQQALTEEKDKSGAEIEELRRDKAAAEASLATQGQDQAAVIVAKEVQLAALMAQLASLQEDAARDKLESDTMLDDIRGSHNAAVAQLNSDREAEVSAAKQAVADAVRNAQSEVEAAEARAAASEAAAAIAIARATTAAERARAEAEKDASEKIAAAVHAAEARAAAAIAAGEAAALAAADAKLAHMNAAAAQEVAAAQQAAAAANMRADEAILALEAGVAAAKAEATAAIAAAQAGCETRCNETEEYWRSKYEGKAEELGRVQENLLSVTMALSSEVERSKSIEDELNALRLGKHNKR